MLQIKLKKFILFFIILFAFSQITIAEEQKSKGDNEVKGDIELGKIVVTAQTSDEPLMVDIQIDESAYYVGATAVDMFDTLSGIDIGRTSLGTPDREMVKIRGLGEDRFVVNIDGRPITGAGVFGGYYVDWSLLSLQDIERIELIKGGASAEYGNTLGGVVNIVPREPKEKVEFKFTSGIKEYNSYDNYGVISSRLGNFAISVSGGYRNSDGYLRNNYLERKDFSSYLYYFLPDDGKIKIGMRYNTGEYGMVVDNDKSSSFYNNDYPESSGTQLIGPNVRWTEDTSYGVKSHYTKERYEWDALFEKNVLGINWEVRAYYNDEERTDKFYERSTRSLALERTKKPDHSWGWGLKAGKKITDHDAKIGAEGNYLGYGGIQYKYIDNTYLAGNFSNSKDQYNISRVESAFAQDRWSMFSNLDIYAGLRFDYYRTDYNNTEGSTEVKRVEETPISPKFGIFYEPALDIETFATVARAVNFPTIPKYYWYYSGYQPEDDGIDRKDLTFEDSIQYEVGAKYKGIRDSSFELRIYHYQIDDYLRWIFGYSPSRVVYNIDNVKLTGIEIDINSMLYKDVYVFANYTFQTTKKTGDILDKSNINDEIGELPMHKFNIGLKYQSDDGALAQLTCKWVDKREIPLGEARTSTADTAKMDSYYVLNGIIKHPFWKNNCYAYFGCENILNKKYEERYEYPMPERMFFGGIEVKI